MASPATKLSQRSRESSGKPLKTRVDLLLVERALAPSRQRAQALILAGRVLADNQKVHKCGELVADACELCIIGEPLPYASRGGVKLEAALHHFGVDPAGKVCLDIGASTGGFTDCLLQRGAIRVFAVDAGTNQLDWCLRTDPRVVSLEKCNARYLAPESIGQAVDLVTVDVSFISATLILPVVAALLKSNADVLVLAKPQFEVGRGQVGKGGIVRDARLRAEAVSRVSAKLEALGFGVTGTVESVLPGAGGNLEYFVHARWGASGTMPSKG
jgi:23S rRNA (cytidine1920-2'-O)/16S rRNA (cytidine1409-2'-O)-methyltransferase